ncbi:sugar kinase [Caulobacter sp. S45]|uniref:sugar kinase n=1 Tax=Caulobacter sp. S45 TaxID=1641861 RepID=UPI00131DCC0B|nr:sugar kinase [Caulobacter sp. S45]
MVDLSTDMAELAGRLLATPGGPGRVLQFASAESGEGVSTVAREFARFVAPHAQKGVWLVELDVLKGEQYAVIAADPEGYGALGAPTRASPNEACFFSVDPKVQGVDGRPWPDIRYLDAYPVGEARWWITRFRREALKPGQSVSIVNAPGYWNTLRAHADFVIIDAPALERSQVAAVIAPLVDATVLVVSADRVDMDGPQALKAALTSAGGRCAGMVFNRAPKPPPRFLSRLLP